ncbi:MAG: cofactor-independent phosphoglycerate mutase [Candidatus Brocadia sp. AMX2]|uniref:Phosphonopyruvate decarboxylase n=1 Tax=Candidatus Brocadia sinica JPN1 TaxID=1197129 RepID=A0ABQ0JUW3_9BACT|nr:MULTISPECIES: cofactor-independent phosphoglycerate mutase [Brocadia]KXK32887.1 MAG: phosphoglycerate mutase [Candidatus Brocadia sinica]MBC6933822.1 cofactor-independent phosphoglycerate mutase [Candidatus Brocadia sp.]MBL1167843.1 cofactor-independent phosphoglycerate mutase [Candidatus Brocadia sp. AMX1]NOG41592.1 cofactor-independent phosphoglycerate mutase [Planctomycetota bacterium]KAA0241556.1 MAG: cofactor-independent phosphoglycerate mutase [Candidatus Brocadia sp. AMX2]
MKYCIIVPDGMADYPIDKLSGRTPVETARTPNLDFLAQNGQLGVVRTIPGGFPAGSDVANLTLLGYDPREYYSGRAPLEAASIGIKLGDDDWAFRCNFITASEDTLEDFCAGHIKTDEASVLIKLLNDHLSNDIIHFYPGKSYRHIMVYRGSQKMDAKCFPPHDIMGQSIQKHLPKGHGSEILTDLMERSRTFLSNHDINKVRIDLEENPANMIWLWGQGHRPKMPTFKERFNLTGAVITAVDLIKGIACYLGWDIIHVPGATGYLDTNYANKGHYAIQALETHDVVLIHIEAPDEAGHEGNVHEKVQAIEQVDCKIIGPVLEAKSKFRDLRILVLPDHYTPIVKRTHTPESVPFAAYGAGIEKGIGLPYSEANAHASGLHIKEGHRLIEHLISGSFR